MKIWHKCIINLPVILSLLYAGILIGVSFLATPIKFNAPLLTLPAALDVGRVTFNALIKLEWFLISGCFVALLLNTGHKPSYAMIIIMYLLLILQTFWLLPVLEQRVILIQHGQRLEKSYFHILYVLSDLIKIIFLFSIAFLRMPFKKS